MEAWMLKCGDIIIPGRVYDTEEDGWSSQTSLVGREEKEAIEVLKKCGRKFVRVKIEEIKEEVGDEG